MAINETKQKTSLREKTTIEKVDERVNKALEVLKEEKARLDALKKSVDSKVSEAEQNKGNSDLKAIADSALDSYKRELKELAENDKVMESLACVLDRAAYQCGVVYNNYDLLSIFVDATLERDVKSSFVELYRHGRMMKEAMAVKIANFYLAYAEGKINNKSQYYLNLPLVGFNEAPFTAGKREEGDLEAWRIGLQLFDIDTTQCYRLNYIVKALMQKGIDYVISDDCESVSKKTKKKLKQAKERGIFDKEPTDLYKLCPEKPGLGILTGGPIDLSQTERLDNLLARSASTTIAKEVNGKVVQLPKHPRAVLTYMTINGIMLIPESFLALVDGHAKGEFEIKRDLGYYPEERGEQEVLCKKRNSDGSKVSPYTSIIHQLNE